jgi:hypothetical protein
MIGLLHFVLWILASPFKSKSRLEAENAVLRHQLIVLRRKMPGRPRLTNNDRWFLIQLYRWFPSILQPSTLDPLAKAAVEEIQADSRPARRSQKRNPPNADRTARTPRQRYRAGSSLAGRNRFGFGD